MLEVNKETQINQILNIVKLSSLAFPAIAFLQYYTDYCDEVYFLNRGLLIIAVLMAILLIYSCWTYLQSQVDDASRVIMDSTISLLIAFASVMLTGAYASDYKFLFIFVIIYSSIECSRKLSLSITGFSALIILAIDLLLAPQISVNSFFEKDIVLICVFLIISWTIGYYVELRKKHIATLQQLANIDGLTGIYNHRYFYDYLKQKVSANVNESKSGHCAVDLSLLFIDLDDFKRYNDLYGHQKGDQVLHTIAAIMGQMFADRGLTARYGGEEFVVLLNDTDEAAAMQLAEKFRKKIQEHYFEGQENMPSGNLTVSVGVSSYPSKAKTDAELIRYADEACYRAKFLYKNRVEAYYSLLEDYQSDADEIDSETITSIKTLIAVINAKDKYTFGHVERVVFYCTLLAEKMAFSEEDKKKLVYAAYLHDIGKINIAEEILVKSDPLTPEERKILQTHPQKADEIVQKIKSLNAMRPIILQHHEHFDGSGYPQHLRGEEICCLARMLAVVDSFDAMTSIRPYQPRKTAEQAMQELTNCSGLQFDPVMVRVFIDTMEPIISKGCSLLL